MSRWAGWQCVFQCYFAKQRTTHPRNGSHRECEQPEQNQAAGLLGLPSQALFSHKSFDNFADGWESLATSPSPENRSKENLAMKSNRRRLRLKRAFLKKYAPSLLRSLAGIAAILLLPSLLWSATFTAGPSI